jgi:hypothetical protein
MKWQEILPVFFSILVIILIAIFEKQSKLIAAITATMPVTITLGLWIIYAAAEGESVAVSEFTLGMMLAILPTIGFLVTVWLASRAEMKLVPMIVLGYTVWGLGSLLLFGLRRILGL